jgi:hypothetical protein
VTTILSHFLHDLKYQKSYLIQDLRNQTPWSFWRHVFPQIPFVRFPLDSLSHIFPWNHVQFAPEIISMPMKRRFIHRERISTMPFSDSAALALSGDGIFT